MRQQQYAEKPQKPTEENAAASQPSNNQPAYTAQYGAVPESNSPVAFSPQPACDDLPQLWLSATRSSVRPAIQLVGEEGDSASLVAVVSGASPRAGPGHSE